MYRMMPSRGLFQLVGHLGRELAHCGEAFGDCQAALHAEPGRHVLDDHQPSDGAPGGGIVQGGADHVEHAGLGRRDLARHAVEVRLPAGLDGVSKFDCPVLILALDGDLGQDLGDPVAGRQKHRRRLIPKDDVQFGIENDDAERKTVKHVLGDIPQRQGHCCGGHVPRLWKLDHRWLSVVHSTPLRAGLGRCESIPKSAACLMSPGFCRQKSTSTKAEETCGAT
jgi:hypothetical protein